MKHPMKTTAAAGVAALTWACATSRPLPVEGTPSASSAVYGSVIVPVKNESDGSGVLRITNNTQEAIQVFLTTPNGDTFLRMVRAGNSEPVHVPGKSPGDTIALRAKTQSGREYTSRQSITLSANSCARNYGTSTAAPECEWTVP
jgi:hypothetical protein